MPPTRIVGRRAQHRAEGAGALRAARARRAGRPCAARCRPRSADAARTPRSRSGVPSATWSVIVRIVRRSRTRTMRADHDDEDDAQRDAEEPRPTSRAGGVSSGSEVRRRRAGRGVARRERLIARQPRAVGDELQLLDRQRDRARQRPAAVPDAASRAAPGSGAVAAGRRLQRRGELARVQRVDPGVALEHGEQRRRVGGAVDDAVVRRVAEQPAELGRGRRRRRTPRST